MTRPPSGTVTFLFTDIQGSTKLWQSHPREMRAAVARHDTLLKDTVAAGHGWVFKTVGDAVCAAFETALDGLTAAIAAQIALAAEPWPLPSPILVRMALHTGEAEERDADYFGPALNRVARLLAIGHGGQTLLSLVTTELVRDALPDGVTLRAMGEHRLKDLYRPEPVYQVLHTRLPSEFPALNSLDAHPHNLPVQPTPFIGREEFLAEIGQALQRDEVRLLTVTGPGGMGKTRVALQAAADAIERFPGGAWFVDLAPLVEPAHLPGAIARVLRVKEGGTRPLLEALLDHLREKRVLLVLDNFEQLMPAAPQVARILSECPSVKVIATSREPLSLRGEQVRVLPPLALPPMDRRDEATADRIPQFDAVRLFIDRAVAIDGDFRVSNETAPAIAGICAQLDGIPLAIELAAARVRLLSPQEILQRLDRRLQLLVTTMRDLPERQRTLRAAIEWSYGLLDDPLKVLFHALAPFAGSFTLEAAESVTRAAGGRLDLLAGAEALAAKSLLVRDRGPESGTRLRMLETIREFALERLDEGADGPSLRQAHAAYYAGLAGTAEFEGPNQKTGLDRVDADYENIRAALAHLQATGNRTAFVGMAAALAPFWAIRCRLTEGNRWLSLALGCLDSLPTSLRANTLAAAGVMARQSGEYDRSLTHLEQALALFEAGGDEHGKARVLCDLGRTLYRKNDLERAKAVTLESMERALQLRDLPLAANAGMGLGIIGWRSGRDEQAFERFTSCRSIFKERGYQREEAQATNNLGLIYYQRGDYQGAVEPLSEAMSLQEYLGDRDDLLNVYNNLADNYFMLGSYDSSRRFYEKVIDMAAESGNTRVESMAHAGIADVFMASNQWIAASNEAEKALTLAMKTSHGVELGIAYRVLGDVTLLNGDPVSAEQYYQQGIPFLEAASQKSELNKALCGREFAVANTHTGERGR